MKYSVHRQITVALENVPGRLASICEILSEHGINIEGICVIDNVEQGVVRLLTTHPAQTKSLLTEQDIYTVEADVLVLELMDQRGILAKISAALAAQKINIDYLYGSFHRTGTRTMLILKVSDLAGAQRVLDEMDVK